MLRYLQTHQSKAIPRALVVISEDEVFLPVFVHAAIDQDRPLGDAETFHKHAHNLYHIVLYTDSSGYYTKCGKRYRATPGTLVIVSPGEPHDFVSFRSSSVYSEITFSFKTRADELLTLPFEDILRLYSGVTHQLDNAPHLSKAATQELLVVMIQIMDYLKSPSLMSDFYAQRALTDIFDIILTHCCTEMFPTAEAEPNNSILQVKQYIDEHYTDTITVEDLTSVSHCSKGHLFRTFKKYFRISPLAYQQDLRFEAAQRLLRFTSLRCYEIAQRVGYTDVYYFHRQFKKRLGVTPLNYRQAARRSDLGRKKK